MQQQLNAQQVDGTPNNISTKAAQPRYNTNSASQASHHINQENSVYEIQRNLLKRPRNNQGSQRESLASVKNTLG